MPFRVGPMELVLVLLLALLIFGPDRIAKLGGELGKSISAFQREMKKENEDTEEESSTSEAA
ncbi:MAG: twin-arginine translocase TatA/TatE family subunit [Chloroflexi bacterium]|nr:twin-arginine translocase TatA/TatE family subunit [Chloroflexota bacterium]